MNNFDPKNIETFEKEYLNFLIVKVGLTETTVSNYEYKLKRFKSYLEENNLPLDRASCEEFIGHLKKMGNVPRSLNTYIDLFFSIEKFFLDREIPHLITKGFKRFKFQENPIDVLTLEEIEKLTTTPITYYQRNMMYIKQDEIMLLLTTFLAYSGCRINEALTLKIKDVNVEEGKVLIRVSKNKTVRMIYLPDQIMKRLKPLLDRNPEELVFTTWSGKKIMNSNYIHNLQLRAERCGITKRVHPHLFRHSFATQLLVDGVPIEQVATILGHKDISTTFVTYTHLAEEVIKDSMFKHTLFKRAIEPDEVIRRISNELRKLNLDSDSRFEYVLAEGNGKIAFQLVAKKQLPKLEAKKLTNTVEDRIANL